MSRTAPRFDAAGSRLWKSIGDAYELDERESANLELACRQADDVARLEASLNSDGLIVPGATGAPKLNTVVSELRMSRLALSKLLDAIALPDAETEKPMTGAQRRAQKAADARWSRVRRREEQAAQRQAEAADGA